MRNALITLVFASTSVIIGCVEVPQTTSTTSELTKAEVTTSPTPTPSPTYSSVPSPTPSVTPAPCAGKAISIGHGNSKYSSFMVSTSPTSSDQFFMEDDCTWFAFWSDKTWNGGGSGYTARGTFSFNANTVTFQPSGLTYKIFNYEANNGRAAYTLSLQNTDALSSFWTYQNITDHSVKTGLAFQDWIINTGLKTNSCVASQNTFNTCMRNSYDPVYNMNGNSSILYDVN